jgi:hypothetical protein
MSLFTKIKKKLDKPVDDNGHIKKLEKLPNHEKVKVLEYLASIKNLHKDEQ